MTTRIQIASAPDRESVFAEIFVDEKYVASVGRAGEGPDHPLEIEFPGPEVVQDLVLRRVNLDSFLRAVSEARAALDR